LEELIAFNRAQNHGEARLRGVLFALKEHRTSRPSGDIQEIIQRLLQRGGERGGNPRVERVLDVRGDRDDERIERRTGREHHLPEPQDRLGTLNEIAGEDIVGGSLGKPVRQPRPGRIIKGLPAEIGPDPLQLLGLRGQALREIAKEDQGEIKLPCQMIGNRDGGRRGFWQKASIGTQRTELHGEASSIGLPATPPHFDLVPCRPRPILDEVFGPGGFR
jgi:hypothetical protein